MTYAYSRSARRLGWLLALVLGGVAAIPALAQSDTYKPGGSSPEKEPRPGRREQQKLEREGREIFGGGGDERQEAAGDNQWSIIIMSFREGEQDREAQIGLERVRNLAGLKEAYLEKRGAATVIAFGRYPSQQAGQKDLERIRNLSVTEAGITAQPFKSAMLAPPDNIKGSIPEYDLRNVRREKPWAAYSLQIGAYGKMEGTATAAELKEFRETAETAAVQLRREGEEAYYFHGPNLSMVLVGTFSLEDFDSQTGFAAPAITAARKRFPHNLFNGQGVRNTVKLTDPRTGKVIRQQQMQPSRLINIPEE